DDNISALKKAMQRPGPSASDVAGIGKKLSAQLHALLEKSESSKKQIDADQARSYLRILVNDALRKTGRQVTVEEAMGSTPAKKRDGVRIDEMDWDEATQLYLGMAALSQALSDAGAKESAAIRADMLA